MAAKRIEGIKPDKHNKLLLDDSNIRRVDLKLPDGVVVDLGMVQELGGFIYEPRIDGPKVGNILEYEFYVSDSPDDFGQPVATGQFNGKREKQFAIFSKPAKGRYVKLRALKSVGMKSTIISELRFFSP